MRLRIRTGPDKKATLPVNFEVYKPNMGPPGFLPKP